GTCQHDGAERRVGIGVAERQDHFLDRVGTEGIHHLLAVDRDACDAVALGVDDVVEFHGASLRFGVAGLCQSGSQQNTSCERSSGVNWARMAGMAWAAIFSGVQPSALCTERTGRGCENRKISLARTPKIWAVTSLALSLARYTAKGAILAVSMVLRR